MPISLGFSILARQQHGRESPARGNSSKRGWRVFWKGNMQPDEKRIEQWLDSALREYGATEARSGLEARVFASLRTASVAERARAGHRRWWMLAGSVATAAIIVALWIGWNKRDRVAHEVSGTKAPVLFEPRERSDHDTAA